MLAARYRMTRSTEFAATVKHGVRAAQPDIVVHVRRDDADAEGPRVGLVIAKSVGTAVQRHQVARRLRHVAKSLIPDLDPRDRVVIRALPGSSAAASTRLEQQLRKGVRRSHDIMAGTR
ncbi:ribonuclease P protein component [Mycolicibacterium komossense]|uniref:Ribonuclease P protein component n=1 Tax=Mycolicibacterium komossense TaxID=1779 RepID=A0ABT3C5E7_9MYCO|nr:ribonuclease P protein component [Mycolicibacterium komossense]MCV7224699.1 ribonuclease P protein component [Mycolicibacterium komossense]